MAIKASATITLSFMVDVKATYRYYKLQASTESAPSIPTSATPTGWTDTEPTYTEGSTNTLYFVDKTVFANDKFLYSAVSKSTSYEAAKAAYNKAVNANNKVDNMQIGGRNLFLNTGVEISNNGYFLCEYRPSNGPLISGETYTATICITPANNVSNYSLYFSYGYRNVATFRVNGTSKQIISSTFVMSYSNGKDPSIDVNYANAQIYRFPNNGTVTQNSTIHWFKIEKGNKATDWTPAPEDITDTINSIEVGGRNLILNSDRWKSPGIDAGNGITSTLENGVLKVIATSGNANWHNIGMIDNVIENNLNDGDPFTFSIEIRSEDSTTLPTIYFKEGMGYYEFNGSISSKYSWIKYTGTWKKENNIVFHFGWRNCSGTYYIRKIKFEKGNKATDWTPAPEDVNSELDDIRTTYTKTIDLKRTNKSIQMNFNTIQQTIENNQNVVTNKFNTMSKYIRFENGNIILGQQGNQITCTISNNRISFLQGADEVAYLSDNKLYIKKSEITNQLQIGNFSFIAKGDGGLRISKTK